MLITNILEEYNNLAKSFQFNSRTIISERRIKESDCQTYAMTFFGLPQYSWKNEQNLPQKLKEGFIPEFESTSSLESNILVTFHRREIFDYYSHYGIVRTINKKNNLLIIESKIGEYGGVRLEPIEAVSKQYGKYIDFYKRI